MIRQGRRPKYITRLNTPAKGIKGWMVRVGESAPSKYFADNSFNGWRGSARAAILYRNNETNYYAIADKPWRPNVTGVVGISISYRVYGFNCYKNYVAIWYNKEGKQRKRMFGCTKHGDGEAFKMALAKRQEGLENLRRAKINAKNR